MGTEHSISINRAKLKNLFKRIRKIGGAKYVLADKFNISYTIFDNYLKQGKEYIEKYRDKITDILDLDTDFIEENFELKKEEVKEEFLNKTDETGISDRNRGAWDIYYYNALCEYKESHILEYQKNIIENTKFDDNEDLNEKIKILLHFRLIYDRAQLSITEEDLYIKHKFSKTSSKHLGVIMKDLERRCPDDFGILEKEEKQVQQIGTINNIFQLVQALDSGKQIEKKEDIIDVEYEKDED